MHARLAIYIFAVSLGVISVNEGTLLAGHTKKWQVGHRGSSFILMSCRSDDQNAP